MPVKVSEGGWGGCDNFMMLHEIPARHDRAKTERNGKNETSNWMNGKIGRREGYLRYLVAASVAFSNQMTRR
jgi:hypothetical protein